MDRERKKRSLSVASLSAPDYTSVTKKKFNRLPAEYFRRLTALDDCKLTKKKISSTSAYSDHPFDRELEEMGKDRDGSKITSGRSLSFKGYSDNPSRMILDRVRKDDSKLTEEKISSPSAYSDNPFDRELEGMGKARDDSKITMEQILPIRGLSYNRSRMIHHRVRKDDSKLTEKKISSPSAYSDNPFDRELEGMGKAQEDSKITIEQILPIRGLSYNRSRMIHHRVRKARDDSKLTGKKISSTNAYSDNPFDRELEEMGKARDDSKLTEKKISSTSTYSDNPFDRELDRMGKARNEALRFSNRRYRPGTEGHILNKDELDTLCRLEGRKSFFLMDECEKVCTYIKGISDAIVHVWPAYKTETETTVTFIVFARRDLDLENVEWTTELRVAGQYNNKNNTVSLCKEKHPLSTEMAREISSLIDIHSEDLMQNHKYLSAISASSAMFETNEKGEQIIVPKPCIVLYALVAEFIPLLEEKYPETLGRFPVCIREGEFRFCGASATEFQETLCLGCKITYSVSPYQLGTLGGFVEHPEYGLCGITCAHVFFNEQLKFTMLQNEVYNADSDNVIVHQPSNEDENSIGKLVKLVFKKGDSQRAGVDLAMFTIEKRPPVAGTFPDDNRDTDKNKYESGKVWGKQGIPFGKQQVHKFGCVSGKTYGNIEWTNMAVREIYFTSDIQGCPANYTLFKQYHIISVDIEKRFCEKGDSGSLVFMEDEQHDYRCIGMVVGFLDDNTAAVTPVTDILKELDVNSLKSFQQKVNLDPLNKRLEEIENRLHGIEALLRDIRDKN